MFCLKVRWVVRTQIVLSMFSVNFLEEYSIQCKAIRVNSIREHYSNCQFIAKLINILNWVLFEISVWISSKWSFHRKFDQLLSKHICLKYYQRFGPINFDIMAIWNSAVSYYITNWNRYKIYEQLSDQKYKRSIFNQNIFWNSLLLNENSHYSIWPLRTIDRHQLSAILLLIIISSKWK